MNGTSHAWGARQRTGDDQHAGRVDQQGREEPLAPAHAYFQPRVSTDGTRVAVAIDGQGIWLWDLVRRNLTQLTSDSSRYAFSPVWTRDGHSLLFFSLTGLFRQTTDGIGAADRIGTGIPSDVTPDGTRVVFSPGARDIMLMGLDATRQVPLVQTPFNERNGVVSPDGR
jgi:Tol biopolymer transport system component